MYTNSPAPDSRIASAGLDIGANHDADIYGFTLPLIILASIAVALRIAVRLMRGRPEIECDDVYAVVALVFTWGTAACCYVGLAYGVGRHASTLTPADVVVIWKCIYSQMILYATSVTFAKVSALLFYRRLFHFTWLFWVGLFLVISYWVTAIIIINIACRPTDYLWYRFARDGSEGFCDIDVLNFFFANGIWAMILDGLILFMPIPRCLKLQMPPSERAAVIGILLVGGGVCITSIMRIIALHKQLHSTDLTWVAGPVFMWSSIEPSMAIICACLPTFAPFLRCWYWSLCAKASTVRNPSCPLAHQPPGGYSASSPNNAFNNTDALSKQHDRQAFRASMHRRAWGPLEGIDDLANLTYHGRLRDDDEVELTTTISGPVSAGMQFGAMMESKGENGGCLGSGLAKVPEEMREDVIHVERGLAWHASPVEEKDEPVWEPMGARLA